MTIQISIEQFNLLWAGAEEKWGVKNNLIPGFPNPEMIEFEFNCQLAAYGRVTCQNVP